ncbi:MAG: RNA 2'-phosphotransferase [Myxococcota bacterium]
MARPPRKGLVEQSKFLSWALRHDPSAVGLALDDAGWVDVDQLLAACRRAGHEIDRARLEEIVATSDKRRFAFDPARTRIRAQQGHSVAVDLQHPIAEPPARLFHGTVSRFLAAILREGLLPRDRHAVHLAASRETAEAVGRRRGAPVVLEVDAAAMRDAGHRFARSPNGVWLVDTVPPGYLQVLSR